VERQLYGIVIEGDSDSLDSFAACITAALKHWGCHADYDLVAGLSGAAFSPVWDETEDCTAWWMELGDDNRTGFLGEALGFTAEASPDLDYREYERVGLPEENQRFWKRVRDAVQAGTVVLMGNWPVWRILTGWNDDLKQLRMSSPTGMPIPNVFPFSKLYILTPSDPTLTPRDAVVGALKFGADIASGAFTRPGFRYGGALYQEAANRLREKVFCVPCSPSGRDWSCASRTIWRLRGAHGSAVRFLEYARGELDNSPALSQLDWAAECYRRMLTALKPYTDIERFHRSWDQPGYREKMATDMERVARLHRDAAATLAKAISEL